MILFYVNLAIQSILSLLYFFVLLNANVNHDNAVNKVNIAINYVNIAINIDFFVTIPAN